MKGVSLQQNVLVDFYEHFTQCDDCRKEFTPHTWNAVVQVRQKTANKKTFYYIEQLILKNNAHDKVIKVEYCDDGLDFFYKNRAHAMRLVDFLQTILPTQVKQSKQLISHDDRNNTYNYKYTFSLEIPRVCKEDLAILPPKLCKEIGGLGPVLLCYKVTTQIHFLDPQTLKRVDLNAQQYFHYEPDIQLVTLHNRGAEFLVQSFEKISKPTNLNESQLSSITNTFIDKLAEVVVSRVSDWQLFTLKTHLGEHLRVGQSLIGYDVQSMNITEDIQSMPNVPDVILVKKMKEKKSGSSRIWKLRRLDIDGVMVDENYSQKKNKKEQIKNEDEYEEFLDELEQNPDMRQKINLYKNEEAIKRLSKKQLDKKMRQKIQKKEETVREYLKVKSFKKPADLNL